jgi:hypothetical protein
MKLLASSDARPQDAMDARALVAEMSPDDLNRARAALRLIEQPGTNRGKPLVADFERWVAGRST